MRSLSALAALLVCVLPGVAAGQTVPSPAPLVFEPTPRDGEYLARAPGVEWALRGGHLIARSAGDEVGLTLTGTTSGARLTPRGRTRGVSHYYLGHDPSRWRTFVPRYRELLAEDVRPGVDLLYHAGGRDLEFDLRLRPGADLAALRLAVHGAPARVDDDGAVAIALAEGELRLQPPVVYQEQHDGTHLPIDCRYRLAADGIAFELGAYDSALALTIDPVVTFATLLGGAAGADEIKSVHLDAQGNLLVAGKTQASDFPLLNAMPYGYRFDIGFVTKFDAAGALVFSTFFGGTSGSCVPVGIGADPDGQVVFGGNTTAPDLPTTSGVVQPTAMGADWFFTDLLADGSLSWCTYYGGMGNQTGMRALKVLDIKRGSVLAVGVEGGFPIMPNAYSAVGNVVCAGIFGGNVLWASTTCGFSGTPNAVDVTSQGHIVVTGMINGTGSGLPTTLTSVQPSFAGGLDGFVFVFTGQANSLVWCTYFGGSGGDIPRAVHAEPGAGTVVVTIAGDTSSNDLPLANAIQSQRAAGQDGFVAQIDGLTQTLTFATYLGGADPGESVTGVGVDGSGYVIVAGSGNSRDLPYTNALKYANAASNRDVMLWRLSPTGALDWCTMWGGGGNETLNALDVATGGEIAVGGFNAGVNFPATANALPSNFTSQDGFVARLDPRSLVSYGRGTPGYNAFVPVLAGGGPSAIGTTTLLQIHDGRAQAAGVLFAGLGRTNLPLFNGTLLTTPLLQLTIVLNGSTATAASTWGGGWLHVGIPIPNNASSRGIVIDWQAALLDAAAAGGVALTNGVELTIQ